MVSIQARQALEKIYATLQAAALLRESSQQLVVAEDGQRIKRATVRHLGLHGCLLTILWHIMTQVPAISHCKRHKLYPGQKFAHDGSLNLGAQAANALGAYFVYCLRSIGASHNCRPGACGLIVTRAKLIMFCVQAAVPLDEAARQADERSLFVAPLPYNATLDVLTAFFNKEAPVNAVRLRRHVVSKDFRGSVFVEFASQEDAAKVWYKVLPFVACSGSIEGPD